MRFFNNLLRKTIKIENKASATMPSELEQLNAFDRALDFLLSQNVHIAKRDYIKIIDSFSETYEQFHIIRKSNLLEDYCRKNHVDILIVYAAAKCQ